MELLLKLPEWFSSFINLVFLGLIALFPVVNPIGASFIVSPFFVGLSKADRRFAVKRIALYVLVFCTVILLIGHYILALFGITVPVVQVAGGIMICKFGWDMLSATPTEGEVEESQTTDPVIRFKELRNKLFYPIVFPTTVGAGTISVIFTLSAHSESVQNTNYFVNVGAIFIAILITSFAVYLFFNNASRVVKFLGTRNEQIVKRIMAFLIFCVGLQIAVGGISNLITNYLGVIGIH